MRSPVQLKTPTHELIDGSEVDNFTNSAYRPDPFITFNETTEKVEYCRYENSQNTKTLPKIGSSLYDQ